MAAPAPGTTTPGDLYVDAGSKQLWLGVDAAVDPSEAILISDITATLLAIAAAQAAANAYTDGQVATKAPLVHTHTAADITDFTAAVNAIIGGGSGNQFKHKMIMMYSGLLSDIGTGDLAGWALCDGSNGTPDLRDKFVLGAGNRNVGIPNSLTKVTTSANGAHVHTVNGTALTEAQMPAHAHAVSGSGVGGTDAQGNHAHSTWAPYMTNLAHDGSGEGDYTVQGGYSGATSTNGNHAHNVSVSVTGATDSRGSGQSHTHTMAFSADHTHEFTSNTLREAAPYLTLAFIMKLP